MISQSRARWSCSGIGVWMFRSTYGHSFALDATGRVLRPLQSTCRDSPRGLRETQLARTEAHARVHQPDRQLPAGECVRAIPPRGCCWLGCCSDRVDVASSRQRAEPKQSLFGPVLVCCWRSATERDEGADGPGQPAAGPSWPTTTPLTERESLRAY